MKKSNLLLALLAFLVFTAFVSPQVKTGADFFSGLWSVVIKDTPNGDTKMFIKIEKLEDKITGAIQDSTGKEMIKVTSIEIKDDTTANVSFKIQDFDVNMVLNKKDDDHIKGSLMGMFNAVGERVKQ